MPDAGSSRMLLRRLRIFGQPAYSRNTLAHGHQVVCSARCRDVVLERALEHKPDATPHYEES